MLVAGLVLAVALAAGIGYAVWFWPGEANRRELARRARADYENARGTRHLHLLKRAQAEVGARQAQVKQAQAAAQARAESLARERRSALVAALEHHLAYNRFEVDVDGVGPVLAERILEQAFQGRLADLTRASDYVEGIGFARQQAINQWVYACHRRQPALLDADFPGKAEVVQRYAAALAAATAEAQRLAAQQTANEQLLARLHQACAALERVTIHDFERALVEPGAANPALEAYLRGVYAEWEPVPDWFAKLESAEAH